jgi:hypothetical protein
MTRKPISITLPADLLASLDEQQSRIEAELRRPVPRTAVIEILLLRALKKPGACIRKEARALAAAPPQTNVRAQAAAEVRTRRQETQGLQERILAVGTRLQRERKERSITLPDFVREVRQRGLSMKPAEIHRFFAAGHLEVSPDTASILTAIEAWLDE